MSLSPQGDTVTPITMVTMTRETSGCCSENMERLDVSYIARRVCMDSTTLQNNLAVP